MKQDRIFTPSNLKLFNTINIQYYLFSLFSIFLLVFASGLLIGIALSFYLNNHFPLYFQIQQFPTSLGFRQSIPPSISPIINIINNNVSSTSEEVVWESPNVTVHNMSDDGELLLRASEVSRKVPEEELIPKVAFMFMTWGPLPLAALWERFFYGNDQRLYSIYVHHSSSTFNLTFPQDSVFYGRSIPSKEVIWGGLSMVEAERRLLANALLDLSNQRFVLLSESCIPLFNFSTIYTYLINSSKTYVETFDFPSRTGRGRYNPRMMPLISLHQWRKGSQWFQIDRALAIGVVSDQIYFDVFKRFHRLCCGDEHYLPTLVNIKFRNTNANRTLTWVDWPKNGFSHPLRFSRYDITYGFLERLRYGSTCEYNGESTDVCHLFARKFTTSALNRLLMFAPKIMQFN